MNMNGKPVSDSRSPGRADRVTSASSHPELLQGDLAVPPRPHTSITSINHAIASDRSRRAWGGMLAIGALTALFTVGLASRAPPDEMSVERQRLARACMEWHLAAGAVAARLLQSTRDADLVQAGDAVFRMRRARRNCDAGWFVLACQDYHAVTTGAPGVVMGKQVFSCARVANSTYLRD